MLLLFKCSAVLYQKGGFIHTLAELKNWNKVDQHRKNIFMTYASKKVLEREFKFINKKLIV